MKTTSLKRGLAKVRHNCQAARYSQALAEVDRLLQYHPDSPRLHVLRGELIQLLDDKGSPALEEAKIALQRAAELDDDYPAAFIELGHYWFAVEDDAGAAAKHFHKAIALCKSLLREALLGQAEALSELGRRRDSLACLAQAYWLESHDGGVTTVGNEDEILHRLDALRRAQ